MENIHKRNHCYNEENTILKCVNNDGGGRGGCALLGCDGLQRRTIAVVSIKLVIQFKVLIPESQTLILLICEQRTKETPVLALSRNAHAKHSAG